MVSNVVHCVELFPYISPFSHTLPYITANHHFNKIHRGLCDALGNFATGDFPTHTENQLLACSVLWEMDFNTWNTWRNSSFSFTGIQLKEM